MPKTRNPCPADFRDQIVALHRAGRSIRELAQEFEPCAETIYGWIKQADRDGGYRADILSSDEREELRRLRKENRRLKQECDILSKGCQWLRHRFEKPLATPGLQRTR